MSIVSFISCDAAGSECRCCQSKSPYVGSARNKELLVVQTGEYESLVEIKLLEAPEDRYVLSAIMLNCGRFSLVYSVVFVKESSG